MRGALTEQRKTEGFLIPLGEPRIAGQLAQFFQGEFRGQAPSSEAYWTPERQKELVDLVAQIPCFHRGEGTDGDRRGFLQLDDSRLSELTEAWLPVLTPYGKGILIHENSD